MGKKTGVEQLREHISKGKIIGVDSSLFIYLFERNTDWEQYAAIPFELGDHGQVRLVTSVVTVAETLTLPFREQAMEVVDKYEQVFTQRPDLTIVDLTLPLARVAADLRGRYALRLPDAFQLAAALSKNATIFVTNDSRLKKVRELSVVALRDYTPGSTRH